MQTNENENVFQPHERFYYGFDILDKIWYNEITPIKFEYFLN